MASHEIAFGSLLRIAGVTEVPSSSLSALRGKVTTRDIPNIGMRRVIQFDFVERGQPVSVWWATPRQPSWVTDIETKVTPISAQPLFAGLSFQEPERTLTQAASWMSEGSLFGLPLVKTH